MMTIDMSILFLKEGEKMIRRNEDIRKTVRDAGLTLWMVAEAMGISEATMTRKLRNELAEEEKQHILNIIREKAGENNG